MVNLAKISIWGEYAGAVLWDGRTETASFEYDPDFSIGIMNVGRG